MVIFSEITGKQCIRDK